MLKDHPCQAVATDADDRETANALVVILLSAMNCTLDDVVEVIETATVPITWLYAVNTSNETEEDLTYVVASDATAAIREAGGIGAMRLGAVANANLMRSGAVICPIANFKPLFAS